MIERNPSQAQVIQRHVRAALEGIHTCLPARVEKYDATRQLVNVKPLLRPVHEGEGGEREVGSLPVITNVPVVFPGAGGFRLTFPIQAGDTVLLVFSERSLDAWLEKGGEVDPGDERMFHLSDAVALPGLHANNAPWTGASTTGATLGKDGGLQVHVGPTSIGLGEASPADAVAMAAKVEAQLSALKTAIEGANPVAQDGGTAFKAALLLALSNWPAGVGSTTVKVKG